MPQIPDIDISSVNVPEIPAWKSLPPRSIPDAPPVTLQIGFPVADIPGCVETRNTQPGNQEAYSTDPRGNFVVCDGTMPSYNPLDYTPNNFTYQQPKTPAIDLDAKKPADEQDQPEGFSPVPSAALDLSKVATELPCPPPDAIPLGAKNKSQTAIIIGYERINGKCEAIYEPLDVPTIIGNYLPGAPVVATTATIAAVATTAAIFVKPLGDFLLKAVKPTVKKAIRKINDAFGRKAIEVQSVRERRELQRSLRN